VATGAADSVRSVQGDRWATFDCYGTLIDWNGGIGVALRQVFGPKADVPALLERYHELEPVIEGERYRTYREVLDLCLAGLAMEQGRALDDSEAHALSQSLPEWPAFPEVPDALTEAQRRGWKLAILSNCDRDLIATSLPRLGARFDRVIVAQDVGAYKPKHDHWERFFELTNADPGRHVHVGASLFHDVAPAQEMDMPSVWINRLGESAEPVPDRELSDLSGLPDALEELVPA
jgi:2-haloacid dehalogenase